jgi:competence protein ComEA
MSALINPAGCVRRARFYETQTETPATKTSVEQRVNINSASARELEKLPGIGEAIAERIVQHRQQFGPFRRVEHVMMVQGISEAKFRAIREMISVE